MQSCIDCICLAFLHCVFSNEPSNCLHKRMHSCIGCICLTFLHCVFSNVPSKHLHMRMHNHTCCSGLNFPHCAFPSVSFLRECIVTLVAFFWWHRQVIAFKIFLHPSCRRKGKPMQSWTSHFWCLQGTDCLIFGDPIWLDLRYESESFYNLDVWDIWKYCFHSLFLNGSLVSNIEVWYYI